MKGLLFIILAAFLWAVDTLYRYPLLGKGLDPLQIVFIEHIFLCLFFLPVLLGSLKKLARTSVAELFYFFVIGFLASGIGTLAFTKALGTNQPITRYHITKISINHCNRVGENYTQGKDRWAFLEMDLTLFIWRCSYFIQRCHSDIGNEFFYNSTISRECF